MVPSAVAWHRTQTPMAAQPALVTAALRALIYADLFDQPLRLEEVYRYLTSAADVSALAVALETRPPIGAHFGRVGPLYCLAGREALAVVRHRREAVVRTFWPRARRYGEAIAALPFVRMVAVTGALAVDNCEAGDDVDLLIVTAPGRLWLVRALVLGLVLLARRRGLELCPNYFLTTANLAQPERGLYAARELVQLVPLYGRSVYHQLLVANPWIRDELPNAGPRPSDTSLDQPGILTWPKRAAEALLGGWLGDRLERVERERKIAKLCGQAAEMTRGSANAEQEPPFDAPDRNAFDEQQCKGHFNGHGARITRRYQQQLMAYNLVQQALTPADNRPSSSSIEARDGC